jgi:MoaA/NifB/PqqE/SkfB family radical SAM enzyme
VKNLIPFEAMKRFLSLKTHKIYSLPIVILMPYNNCNCRCVMCDIWKDKKSNKILNESDIENLVSSLKNMNTRWVVMSGGEALMHPGFFRLCDILKSIDMKITILSSGLLLKKYSRNIVEKTNEVIVSLDGSEKIHDFIRGIPGAFNGLKEGVRAIKKLKLEFFISGRCVIQRANFLDWPNIVEASRDIGFDHISFLPADISTHAFNRPNLWESHQINEVAPSLQQLDSLKSTIESLSITHSKDFKSGYIVESVEKLRQFYNYYAAFHGLTDFPIVRCNAPWVSSVIDSDGNIQPCFFHPKLGSLVDDSFERLINRRSSIEFRKNLNVATDSICRKCVCSLNLSPFKNVS